MSSWRNGITSKIAVVLTALALLSANAPAPESSIPDTQIDSAQSTTPATPAPSQPQEPPQTAEHSKTPNTTAPGTKPAKPAPANEPQPSKKHHVETRDSIGPQDGTCSATPGDHKWPESGGTDPLHWNETVVGNDCVLTFTSGTVPYHADTSTSTAVPWDHDNSVTTVNVNNGVSVSERGGRYLFARMSKLKTANVANLDTSQTKDMFALFWQDPALTTINGLDQWNTSNVINMDSMFSGTTVLKTIGNPGLDIPASATQANMYAGSGLTCHQAGRHHWTDNTYTLDWQEAPDESDSTQCTMTFTGGTAPYHADTSTSTAVPWDHDNSVTTVNVNNGVSVSERGGRYLFARMSKLKTANVANLDTSQTKDMFALFWQDPALTTINGLDQWNTSNVTNMRYLFSSVPNVTAITGINGWNTSQVTDMGYMFDRDTKLTTLDLIYWDTTQITYMDQMLPANLNALRLGKKTTLKNAAGNNAFANVGTYTWADKSGISSPTWSGNTAQLATRAAGTSPAGEYIVNGFSYTFPTACTQPGSHTWGTLTWSETFEGEGENVECVLSLDSGTVPNHNGGILNTYVPWTGDNVTKATVKTGVKLAPNTGQTTNTSGSYLFANMPKLKSADVGNLTTTGNTSMEGMFYKTPNLETLTGTENWDTSSVKNMKSTFNNTNLAKINVSNWNTHNVTSMNVMFTNCSELTQITGIGDLDTSSVRNMGAMFSSDYKLTSLDLNNWNTTQVNNMSYMFYGDYKLTSLDLNNWNTASITNTAAVNMMLPQNLQALRLGKKTKLKKDPSNSAFSSVSQPGTWVDKSGSHNDPWTLNPAWSGSTDQLAARAATDSPMGEYVISSVTYSFPTACTQPGSHTWDTHTGNTLTWSETLTGEGENAECVLSLDSGTVPENSAGTTVTTGVPWSDDSVTKATVKTGVKLAPNTSETTYAGGAFLFGRLPRVKTIDVTNLATAGNTSMQGMFWEDPALTTITGLKGFDTSKVTNMNSTFNVTSLASLDVSDWHTGNVTDMNGIFGNNPNLSTITGIDRWDTDKWDTEKVTDMGNMFANDTRLSTLDLNSWDTTSVTSMDGMLPPNLKALRLGKKTTLSNTTNNKAFANVSQSGTWADKSGMSSPAWSGNTDALATRAATADPAGAYIISTFNYTFPPLPFTALPFTGLTRRQLLRGLLILAAGVLALVLAAAVHRARDRRADSH
ncbi:BspA family leucine-rich repeat surface protein [Bifidobacterium sp. ESL0745]|uniref:BspA family leucine-rich repeat surface protein n=1 Tax=Bifidobacterium sp. ESL0745 TaxID=2983226 RepID=UPI0023F87BFC|nr:BspA family leucine-rich repeat surface protein [Bifidobacterium sp. ESL0745]MDF7666011.1 BspA family leucine-rich repeat surface protein [Bifidobacterium sp. ESL0745]